MNFMVGERKEGDEEKEEVKWIDFKYAKCFNLHGVAL